MTNRNSEDDNKIREIYDKLRLNIGICQVRREFERAERSRLFPTLNTDICQVKRRGNMGLEEVKRYFDEKNMNFEIKMFDESPATVELAAKVVGVEPGQIAKTMALKLKDRYIILVVKGDSKIDNKKYKDYFKTKLKMLDSEKVLEVTGHPVGGVCPFGLKNSIQVYLDKSLKVYDTVYPAAGTPNSAVKITIDELEKVTDGIWVDVCV